jgi:hypothetical protein
MKWVEERDLLIAQTKAFVESVTGKTPELEPIPDAKLGIAATPVEAKEVRAAETAAPPKDVQVDIHVPQTSVPTGVRAEIQARLANFRAHQERFRREREQYFSATLAKVRAPRSETQPRPILSTARHSTVDPIPRFSPAPATDASETPSGSRSSENGRAPS